MGRLIALTLLAYIGFYLVRSFTRVFKGIQQETERLKKKDDPKPPWREEDVEDADFEDIK